MSSVMKSNLKTGKINLGKELLFGCDIGKSEIDEAILELPERLTDCEIKMNFLNRAL